MKKQNNTMMGKCKVALMVFLVGLAAVSGCSNKEKPRAATPESKGQAELAGALDKQYDQLESEYGARIGVYAIDTGSDKKVAYRQNERFAFASTFKALAAASVLQQNSIQELGKMITYSKDDLITYSPVTEKHVDTGMKLGDICEAAVRYSDNTAGNLMLEELGGPDGFEEAMREIGDKVTQSSRREPDLNEAIPGDPRDTSTPKALAESLRTFAIDDDVLSAEKRSILVDWLSGNATGNTLIRAGVPGDWTVADKSGAGGYGTRNDIAIVWPPDRKPIVIAILSSRDKKDAKYNDELIKKATDIAMSNLE